MSVWSPDSLEQRLGRKVVPQGSNHFQRVLDDILYSEDTSEEDQQTETCFVQEENDKHENDDDNQRLDGLEEIGSLQSRQLKKEIIEGGEKNNNNIFASTSCTVAKCHQQCSTNKNNKFDDNNTPTVIANCSSKITVNTEAENSDDEHFLYLQETEDHMLTMGTSCSSNFYDTREWHNVKGDMSIESVKPKKQGRFLKKRTSNDRANEQGSLYSPSDEAGTEKNHVLLDTCKFEQKDNNSSDMAQPIRPHTFQANGLKKPSEKRTSLSPEDIFETSCPQLTNNRLSPNVDSSGHVHLSRIVGSGRARATTECDVSPHRLLTRRCHSPNGRVPSNDAVSSNVAHCEERPRSQSWSNGKLGDRATFKTSSLTIRQSLSNSLKILKASSPLMSTDRASKNVLTCTTAVPKAQKVDAYVPEIPHHIKPEEVPRISISKAQFKIQEDDEPDMAPIARRRAASESQTMRPRRLLPRTPDSSDQIQEHAHVRWADEKKGNSLSTSVVLSSIRPRSHSYGAMDMVPQRPILKKVAGL